MSSETKSIKVWIKFESKKQNGETVKLRIQDLPPNRMDDFLTFYTTYFIKDEAFHKAAGIANNTEAIKEYENLLNTVYALKPPQITICCLDEDAEDSNEILAISTVQLASSKESSVEEDIRKLGLELKSKEMKSFVRLLMVMDPIFPKSLKQKYQSFYEGRGIIVHPGYRGLGIASQFVKQRRLLLQENKIPMSCAWMTSIGSQKAAERDGWETVAEVTLEELDERSGLVFAKDVPTYKLMIATLD